MKVMTLNLRFDTERDGKHAWQYRRDLVVELICEYLPDVLGTQEGTPRQLQFLQERLPQYQIQTIDRVWDDTCQYPTLFLLSDRCRIVKGGEFWLSETPHVHRSKNWDSAFPRMVSYALVEDLIQGMKFWTSVTHLDHIGVRARLEQAKILAKWLTQRHGPHILMGDFNDSPHSAVHKELVSEQTGLVDTWQVLELQENESSMTHHNFFGIPEKFRMDWILVSRHFRVLDVNIVRKHHQGLYPSDHFPYLAELAWDLRQ